MNVSRVHYTFSLGINFSCKTVFFLKPSKFNVNGDVGFSVELGAVAVPPIAVWT
jgi:hypothetical protein